MICPKCKQKISERVYPLHIKICGVEKAKKPETPKGDKKDEK